MKSRLVLIVVILFSLGVNAQNSIDLNKKFTKMLLAGDEIGWAKLVRQLQMKQLKPQESESLLLAEYGLIGFYMANEQTSKAKIEIKNFDNHLSKIKKQGELNATQLALDAAIEGFKIVITPKKAIFLSGQNKHKLERALKKSPNNSIALFEKANALFFRPDNLGGDKPQAIKLYEKAFLLMQNSSEKNWVYYNAGAWLGQIYTEFGQLDKARNIYEILLVDAPDYKLVSEILYPNIKQSEFDRKWEAFLKEAGED